VGDGFHEELTLLNHADEPVELTVRIDAASDFADLFEVKDALEKKGTYTARVTGGKLVLGYERESFERAVAISSSKKAKVDKEGLTLKLRLPAHGKWSAELDVVIHATGRAESGE